MIEFFGASGDTIRQFIFLITVHLPRCLIFVFFFPLFGKGFGQGGFIKIAVCAALLVGPVSTLVGAYDRMPIIPSLSLITVMSEILIGSMLGLTMAIPYYIFKAYGALVDVYRGATFAAQASGNTDTGGEELPLETLFGLIFAAIVLSGPCLHAITSHLLLSYLVLPPGSVEVMALKPWAEVLVRLIGDHVVLAFILSGPILVIILMVEVMMQIVAAFTPQMQVYSIQFGFRSLAAIAALLIFLGFAQDEILFLMESHSRNLTGLLGG